VTQKYVYDFAEGNKDLKELLGGKGANLAEMTNLGLLLMLLGGSIVRREGAGQ
jgi:phosphoenolpyruvate synthase/pyruvate phosphate dikinase